ncbi:FMN-dependent NADH-azoreductase [Acetitomaculum ruminis DSM 5522]|uniref:FMN-dependent NADH-azoreductase n=1 Tax=Acetitomaculum ruminis DSM 5522 TaxID=1120918 RepID=A0A1I1A0X7_9FIRM|nr:NAD(P)H-dependent oxidoreductase [Acetitomaculum ruminis]SFB31669.1 FMN-dependent NADH-azoreductase [Acetitomaculum ruminis DSM 5522]
MILFINACVRKKSRTLRLANKLLCKLEDDVKEVRLEEVEFPVFNEEFIILRDELEAKGNYDHEIFDLARDFAKADTIVIAAPYYDLSFPAMLKQYFEQINILGLTFTYSESGIPKGLCKAKYLYYVTTAGGYIISEEYGFGYVKALANTFYGIEDVRQIKAEGLDIAGADVEGILKNVSFE